MIKSPSDGEALIEERQIGIGGLVTIVDPSDLDTKYSPDMGNITFEDGIISPRKGKAVYAEKPNGETQDSLQLMIANNSVGTEYMISVYGNNFYLFDSVNERSIKINQLYTPTETSLIYGYANWNNGLGDDVLYFCNGKEAAIKWPVVLQSIAVAATAADTSIVVDDGVPFPASGTLVFSDGVTTQTKAYSSKSTNTLTLTGALGFTLAIGDSVTVSLDDVSGIEKGKYLTIHDRRLFVGNAYQNEVKLAYSVTNDPEDFTVGADPTDGGILQINDGNGGLTALGDFGEYLAITKENNIMRFNISLNDAGDTKVETLKPLISGKAMGPRTDGASIKVLNTLYYISPSKDIYSLTPTQTGASSSSGVEDLSQNIYNFMNTLYVSQSRATYNNQKIYWALGSGEANNLVLVYDMARKAFTKFDGWNASDIVTKGQEIYYLDRTNGKIYRGLVNYDDDSSGYLAYLFTKRFNWGKSSIPKTADSIYVEGYIIPSTDLYAEVLFNEGGSLGSKIYKISGGGTYVQQVALGALSEYPMAVIPLGLSESGSIGVFRCYLSIPNKYGFYNIQVKFYSSAPGSLWGLTRMAINPVPEPNTPSSLKIDPIN